MTDLTIVISEKEAERIENFLNDMAVGKRLNEFHDIVIDNLRYSIKEARDKNELREKLHT